MKRSQFWQKYIRNDGVHLNYTGREKLAMFFSQHISDVVHKGKVFRDRCRMVQAWYIANCAKDSDRNEELHLDPPSFVAMEDLKKLSGVEYFKIDVDNIDSEGKLKEIKEKRGYTYEDFLEASRESLPDYDETLNKFYKEHLHTDEEIRLFVEGGGYFDVRDKNDRWIRIKIGKGDLIILPAGIYHRFTMDKKCCAKIVRLGCGNPVWTAHNRPADEHPVRKEYLSYAANGFQAKCH